MDNSEALAGLPQGWFHHGEAVLDTLRELKAKTVVELGTWRGASAIAMARVVREWGGVVHCVDTWTGDINGVWGTRPGMPGMILEAAANAVARGVAPWIRFIPATTIQAAAAWNGPKADFVLVDADHTREATLADILAWWPHIRRGGIIAGDDYDNPMYPGVREAWDLFLAGGAQYWPAESGVETPPRRTNPPGMKFPWGRK